MVFIDILFGAYGGRKPKLSSVNSLRNAVKDQCPEGWSADKCQSMLMKGSDGIPLADDERKFLSMHMDIMRRTRLEAGVSRVNAMISLFRALPAALRWMLFVAIVIAMVVALIPLWVILYTVMKNRWAQAKLSVVIAFTLIILMAYYLLPV